MRKLEALLESRLEAVLGEAIDRAMALAIDRVIAKAIAKALGAELEPTTELEPNVKRARKAKTAPTAPAPAPTAPTAPAPTEPVEDQLLARLERVASVLGEKYGPMLLRRANSVARHALSPKGALAVVVSWAETAPPQEVITILRGSAKLADGSTISGWRFVAYRLGIPIKG